MRFDNADWSGISLVVVVVVVVVAIPGESQEFQSTEELFGNCTEQNVNGSSSSAHIVLEYDKPFLVTNSMYRELGDPGLRRRHSGQFILFSCINLSRSFLYCKLFVLAANFSPCFFFLLQHSSPQPQKKLKRLYSIYPRKTAPTNLRIKA